jgi:hypothetical protein
MLAQVVVLIGLTILPLNTLNNYKIRAQMIGTWRAVATEEDGKLTKVEYPNNKFVITDSTISMFIGGDVVLATNYRIDSSKSPARIYETYTRAPCMSGADQEMEDTIVFDGKRLNLGGMILKRIPR